MRRPFVYPLCALMAGILTGDYILAPLVIMQCGILVILLGLLFCSAYQWGKASLALILVMIFLLGMLNIGRHEYLCRDDRHIHHQIDQGLVTVEGSVLSSEPVLPMKQACIVRCRSLLKKGLVLPVTGDLRLIAPGDIVFHYGDRIRFHSRIKGIHRFQNSGSFNSEKFYHRQGIYASGFVDRPDGITLIRRHPAGGLKSRLEHFREFLRTLLYEYSSTPSREILEAMTIGNQKAIPQEIRDIFSRTGTAHILSISGLHVGIVGAAGLFFILLLLKSSEYLMLRFNIIKIASAATFFPVVIYALVAGMGTPVTRSMLMVLAFLGALLIGRPRDLYNVLCGAALIILILAPENVLTISFQLSFSAVFAILYIVPRFSNRPLPFVTRLPVLLQRIIRHVYIFLLVSLAATVGTLPIVAYYFNQLSAVTLMANLVAVPLLGILALIPVMAFILAAPFSSWLAGLLVNIASFFTSFAVSFIHWLSSFSWASFHFVKPHLIEIALFYLFLFFLVEAISPSGAIARKGFLVRHPSLAKTGLSMIIIFFIADAAYFTFQNRCSTDIRVTAIDVGQGSATLVEFPRGVTMLIDGGGFPDSTFDIGRFVIAPFLYTRRLSRIDIIVLTHPHPDHLQGLIYLAHHFGVREAWRTDWTADDDLYRLWEKALSDNHIKVTLLSAQSPRRYLSGAAIDFFWPPRTPAANERSVSYEDINDSSLVMKISYGANSFLITGDISSRVESLLLQSGRNIRSNLIFVPHHGSASSSSNSFIKAVSPQYAIASAGKKNAFLHPHPAVLERYRKNGVILFRTDQHGAISVRSDGQSIEISPHQK